MAAPAPASGRTTSTSLNWPNARSNAARQLGSDYCPRNGGLFTEVMSLPSASDLPAYAAGKDLLSSGVTACEGAPVHRAAAAPAHRTTGTRRR